MPSIDSTAPSAACAFGSTLQSFEMADGRVGKFYSLPELAEQFPSVKRLPVSLRIVLESVLRNCDGKKVTPEHVEQIPIGSRMPSAPQKFRLWCPVWCCRTLLACRCWLTWRPCAALR